jgi:hypothetical protein
MCRNARGAARIAARLAAFVLATAILLQAGSAAAQSRNRAPGFETIPAHARIVLMPPDVELFSISAGGVLEPKADWTEAAAKHLRTALKHRKEMLGALTLEVSERDADEMAETNALHAAVARAIATHHFGPSVLHLPTKDDKLDWSMGEAVAPIKQRTGADYALFSWIRDSYASSERVVAMVGLALLGIGIPGGSQIGYASLVDLNSGRILWFNRLVRASGDLREADKAEETLSALLSDFPATK